MDAARPEVAGSMKTLLHAFIKQNNMQMMVEMPCGATSWTKDFLDEVWEYQPGFRYVGIDVTPSVARSHYQDRVYKNDQRVKIIGAADIGHPDIIKTFTAPEFVPPGNNSGETAADRAGIRKDRAFIMTRDALRFRTAGRLTPASRAHLPYKWMCGYLRNMALLKDVISVAMVGSYGSETGLDEIVIDLEVVDKSDHNFINLKRPPFNLPAPTHSLTESDPSTYDDWLQRTGLHKLMHVYRLADFAAKPRSVCTEAAWLE